jgi:PAS domain S-box-containing protein
MASRILVVDDKAEEIEPVLALLREDGHDVTLATRSDQAVRLVEQTLPDLIVLDTVMPGLDGIETCRLLKRNTGTSQIPVILITQSNTAAAQAELARAGANSYVTRPVQATDLRQKIGAIFAEKNDTLNDNHRLLEETCQAALTILPCNLAWLLIAESGALVSQAVASDQGAGASEAFLHQVKSNTARLGTGPLSNQIAFSLSANGNPLIDAARTTTPSINVPLVQLRDAPEGKGLFRAVNQLRLSFVHFLPLRNAGQIIGMLVLATKDMHDMASPRGQQILNALVNQAATVADNARLVVDLAKREDQMKVEQAFRKMVLDTMGDGLAVIDEQAVIRYVNNRLLRMSGYTRQELYGNSIGVIFHPAGRERLVNSLKRHGRSTVSFSQQLVTKNGQVVPVLMSRATASTSVTPGDHSTVLVLTDLTEQKRREQALEKQSVRLRALNRAAQAITSALSLDDVVLVMLQSAAEVVQCTSTCLFLKDDDEQSTRFHVVAASGPQAATLRGISVQRGEGIAGKVAETHVPQLVPSVRNDPQLEKQIERDGSSVIAVPLMIMDEVIGVLEAINKVEGQFSQDDIETLENLCAAASVAIENARLFEQTQRRVSELSTMLEASSAVSSTLEISSVLELIARRLAEALNVARCSIASWDRSAKQLSVLAEVCNAYWPPGHGPVRSVTSTPLAITVRQSGQPAWAHINDLGLDPQVAECLNQLKMSALLLVPLRLGKNTNGIIELYSDRSRQEFTPQYLQSVDDAVARWREQMHNRQSENWSDRENLSDLYQWVMRASDAMWCVISTWNGRERLARSLREVGFALWKEKAGVDYALSMYPTMATSLEQGLPMVLYPALLHTDPNERQWMAQAGMHTGLIIPLLVRGEASGLVKLLDTTEERSFDIAEISLCQGIANVVGNAIENAQLYESLEKRANALQAAYDELRQADKLKDDLIQNLSHELQTPLHQVIMQISLLADDAFGSTSDAQREVLQTMLNKLTQTGDLVRDMVSLNTLDTEKLQFAEIRLEDVVESTVRKVQPNAKQAGLKIAPRVMPDLPGVWADPERLSELLEQLLDNAIKFSPRAERKADRIDVVVEDTNNPMLHICVQDYGIGIPKPEFDRIFQRGYQVDSSMTRRFGGTGLGLSLARQIVEAHGGKIWVESTVGEGSQFHFTIPKFSVKFQSGR